MIELTGILGVVLFVFDLWAVMSVIASETSLFAKLAWLLIVLLLPLIGFLIWLIAGPGARRA